MKKYLEYGASILKYLIVIVTIEGAFSTMLGPVMPMSGALGFIYGSRITLVIFGLIVLFSALTLLYGKIRRSRKWTGYGLMAVYLCYFFGAVLNGMAFDWEPVHWVGNAIVAVITGLLFLRWKFKTSYISPRHFVDDVDVLGEHSPPSRRFRN